MKLLFGTGNTFAILINRSQNMRRFIAMRIQARFGWRHGSAGRPSCIISALRAGVRRSSSSI